MSEKSPKSNAWKVAQGVYVVRFTRALAVVWAIAAVMILRANDWGLQAWLGVALGTAGTVAVVTAAQLFRAWMEADLYYPAEPPSWAQDMLDRRGR